MFAKQNSSPKQNASPIRMPLRASRVPLSPAVASSGASRVALDDDSQAENSRSSLLKRVEDAELAGLHGDALKILLTAIARDADALDLHARYFKSLQQEQKKALEHAHANADRFTNNQKWWIMIENVTATDGAASAIVGGCVLLCSANCFFVADQASLKPQRLHMRTIAMDHIARLSLEALSTR
jgi:hypothetical protein